MSATERFWAKVDKDGPVPTHAPDLGPCWLWTAFRNKKGYGRFRGKPAYRVAYEMVVGPIGDGLVPDHLCRLTACVRPSHLEPVTPAENDRRQRAAKTHCKHGHEYTVENTYLRPDSRGGRECVTCRQRNELRYRARKAAA